MQKFADLHGCRLRPHIKTHKSTDIALAQLNAGANGITTAKLSEAETMAEAGIRDIFIANQITHPLKIKLLAQLARRINVIIGIDNWQQVQLLEPFFENAASPLNVRIEIDSGQHRCGVLPTDELLFLAKKIKETPWLHLEGIFTHAGHVYGAQSSEEIQQIGFREGEVMVQAFQLLKSNGIDVNTVSVGSTPTVNYSASFPDVNEIRPGNYVFYDGIQMALQVAHPEQCSLFVLATVTSISTGGKIVIDAGSKALNMDRGAHSSELVQGYGTPVNVDGRITRLSEEHGMLETNNTPSSVIGGPILILPNHACTVVNLYDTYHCIDRKLRINQMFVTARGKSQ